MAAAAEVVILLALFSTGFGQDAALNLILITSSPPRASDGGAQSLDQVEAGLLVLEGGRYACRQATSTTSMPLALGSITEGGHTGGGGAASAGSRRCRVEAQEAAQLALQRVNGNGSILQNHRLTATYLQAECGLRAGLDAFHLGLFDSTLDVGIVGAGCPETLKTVAQESTYFNLPMVASDSLPDDEIQFPYLTRTAPSSDLVAVGVATILRYYSWKRVAVFTQDTPIYASMTELLCMELENDVDLSVIDFSSKTSSVLEEGGFFPENFRVFVLNVDPAIARQIICQAYQRLNWQEFNYVWLTQGWYEDQWWVESEEEEGNCSHAQILEFLRQQRVLGVSHYPSTDTRRTASLVEYINDDSSDEGLEIELSQAAIFAYDAIWSMALGLDAASAELSLACGSGVTLGGYDPLQRGVGREAGRCVAALIKDKIHSLNFDGLSGSVQYENGSRRTDRLTVFQYRNGSATLKTEAILLQRESSEGSFVFEYAPGESNSSVWPDGIPADGSVHREVERFPYLWLWVSSYILNSIVILAALVCLVFTIVFRNRKLVKLTSPNLNYIIIVGVVTFCSSGYMFVYPPVSTGVLTFFCAFRIWTVTIGTSLLYGTINAKMMRIFYIFHNPHIKKRVVKDWQLVLFVLALLVLDLFIIIPTTGVESVRLNPVVIPDLEHPGNFTDSSGTFSHVVRICDSAYRVPILAILFGYKIIIQLIGIVLAFLMRNVEIKVLNDSRETTLALYLSSCILVLVILITLAFGQRLNVYGAGYAYGVPLSCLAVLIVVFFSKMVRLYRDPRGDKVFINTGGVKSATSQLVGTDKIPKVYELEEKVRELERRVRTTKNGGDTSSSLQNDTQEIVQTFIE